MAIRPGDRVIIVDPDNTVLFSDFEPSNPVKEGNKPHLLDIIDAKHQQDVLRVVGIALDRPGKWVGAITEFRGERLRICATHDDKVRTRIVFSSNLLGWDKPS